jgi:hypothetical protein
VSAVYCALVHHPVRARDGSTVTTAVTNLDVHDIARLARTYELTRYFVVTPIEAQRQLVERILSHWRDGPGKTRIPERAEALSRASVVASLEDAREAVRLAEGAAPLVVATAARTMNGQSASYAEVAELADSDGAPLLVIFGTGHGLSDSVVAEADFVLPPIRGRGAYNHLSVRAAAAITFDRLLAPDNTHGSRGGT